MAAAVVVDDCASGGNIGVKEKWNGMKKALQQLKRPSRKIIPTPLKFDYEENDIEAGDVIVSVEVCRSNNNNIYAATVV